MTAKPALGMFAIIMMTITSVDSIRNLPATALFGSDLIFFFTLGLILFLLPSALVASELAAAWPETGGVYVWVKEAFGKRYGFLAIWFQWIENVVWYPTILSFIAGTMAYLISPELAHNKFYLVLVINVVFWGLTFVNLAGIKFSARFTEFCGVAGLLLPMALIIILGAVWYFSGENLAISFTRETLIPDLSDPGLLVSFTAVILTFSGMEIATAHAQDVKNPQKNYPLALMISVVIIFVTMLLGSLAIAIIVPHDHLSLVAGIMQAFTEFFAAYNLTFLTPIIALCIIIGSLGSVSNWIISPSRGLMVALRQEQLVAVLQKENSKGAPANMLIFQGVLVSVIASIFLIMPTINSSYWVLTVIAAQLYMFMYVLMFAAAIYLRYKKPNHVRPFKIIGGKFGICCVAGAGLCMSLFTIAIGFVPPGDISVGDTSHYELILATWLVLMSAPPFILYWWRNKKARKTLLSNVQTGMATEQE